MFSLKVADLATVEIARYLSVDYLYLAISNLFYCELGLER